MSPIPDGSSGVVAALLVAALASGVAAAGGWPLQTFELEIETDGRLTDCPEGWRHDGHHCLLYVGDSRDWKSAQQHCDATLQGSFLASVSSVFQMAKLLTLARRAGQEAVWIGLTGQSDGESIEWDWSDGSQLGFEAWENSNGATAGAGAGAEGNESQLCAVLSTHSKGWHQAPCETQHKFFCGYKLWDGVSSG